MWPFKKRDSALLQLPIDGPWSISEGHHNGEAIIVRTNEGYRALKAVAGYEHQVGIAVPRNHGESELSRLAEMEDFICASLEKEVLALFVASVTSATMRELVFYTRQSQIVEQRVSSIREIITSHEVQLMIQLDKTWSVYSQLR
jgi:hypothetical protein